MTIKALSKLDFDLVHAYEMRLHTQESILLYRKLGVPLKLILGKRYTRDQLITALLVQKFGESMIERYALG